MVRRTGQMGVPVTAIGGEMVVGFDRPRLERIIQRLRGPTPRPATLGVAVKDGPGGTLVGTVRPGTPADRAGVQPGDVIVAVDGAPVGGAEALAQLLRTSMARGGAALTVRRGNDLMELRVPFGAA
jgi:S1-C subfamily serine protease